MIDDEQGKIVIVGGGIAGLFSALLQVKKGNGKKTVLIEKNKLGGLLSCHNYDKHGKFDIGTHILSETGIKKIDDILRPFHSSSEWNEMTGNNRDIVGSVIQNKLYTRSSEIDLTYLSNKLKKEIIDEIVESQGSGYSEKQILDAESFIKRKYGEILSGIILPILESKFKIHPSLLSKYAINFLPITRVNLFKDEKAYFNHVNKNPFLRNIIAFPDQRTIPLKYTSQNKCYYPKTIGIDVFIENIKSYLIKNKVEIYESSKLKIGFVKNNVLKSIKIEKQNFNINSLIWSAGLIPLASFSGLKINYKKLDKPLTTYLHHFICTEKLKCADSFYLYNLDLNSQYYRLTNYQNFTNSEFPNMYKFTVEVIDTDLHDYELKRKNIIESLKSSKILSREAEIIFGRTESLVNGFPVPTLKNYNFIDELRVGLSKRYINMKIVGINSSEKVFFYRDILKDIYSKL